MNEFMVIAIMNEAMLIEKMDKKQNCEMNARIKQILEDEAIFFKISKEDSFKLLNSVGVKDNSLEQVYKKLTSLNMFYSLLRAGKIKEDDNTLIVKYETTKLNELFKKNK